MLQDTGTVHRSVISGQHIGLLAGGVSVDCRTRPLWPVSEPPAVVALGLWSGIRCSPRIWVVGRVRGAGAACLSDDRSGVVMAPAFSSSRCLVAAVACAQWRVIAGSAGKFATGILVVLCGGRGVDSHFQRSFGAVAMVANLDARAMVDRHRPGPAFTGAGVADQSQWTAGQLAGRAVDQPAGVATCFARDAVIAGAVCG